VARDDESVDFESSAAAVPPGGEEDLPEPADQRRVAAQRRTLVIGAAVLVAFALGARALKSHDESPGTPTPTSSASSGAARPSAISLPDPIESDVLVPLTGGGLGRVPGVLVARASDAACPTADVALSCVRSDRVSDLFWNAVLEAFPGAHEIATRVVATGGTGNAGQQLHFAQLIAKAGSVQIILQVQQDEDAVGTGPDVSSDDGRRTVIYRTYRTEGYLVQVLISAPSGHGPSAKLVGKLVADPRLLIAP
jgi:hypothetical protein